MTFTACVWSSKCRGKHSPGSWYLLDCHECFLIQMETWGCHHLVSAFYVKYSSNACSWNISTHICVCFLQTVPLKILDWICASMQACHNVRRLSFWKKKFCKSFTRAPTFEFLDRTAADLGVSVQLGNALNVNKINLPPANSANPCYPSKVEKGGKEKKCWNRKWI